MTDIELKTLQAGDEVRYCPFHAGGDISHKDCENGVVSSVRLFHVFVRYYRNGILQATPERTDKNDLTLIKKH